MLNSCSLFVGAVELSLSLPSLPLFPMHMPAHFFPPSLSIEHYSFLYNTKWRKMQNFFSYNILQPNRFLDCDSHYIFSLSLLTNNFFIHFNLKTFLFFLFSLLTFFLLDSILLLLLLSIFTRFFDCHLFHQSLAIVFPFCCILSFFLFLSLFPE